MTSGDRADGVPCRRTVLAGLIGAGLGFGAAGALTGCTGSSPAPGPTGTPTPTPPSADELAAGRAVLSARSLLDGEAGLRGRPQVVALLAAIAATHRAHLAALGLPEATPSPTSGSPSGTGSPPVTGSASADGSPSGTGSASGTGPATPSVTAFSAAVAISRERAAAAEALADVVPTTPATAGLLARIAAARAVHADLLATAAKLPPPRDLPLPEPSRTPAASASPSSSPSDPSTGSTDAGTSPTGSATGSPTAVGPSPAEPPLDSDGVAALSAILAGEHAAVFAYGLIAARAAPARATLARTLWAAHQDRRDALERRLVATGNAPVAAEAAYDLGRPPTGPAQVVALAVRVEDGLAAVAWGAVTGSTGDVRLEAAADLVRAARRAAAWRGTGVALPGAPA